MSINLHIGLSDLTLDALRAESIKAHIKHSAHGRQSLLDSDVPMWKRLAAMGEEFGEVCRCVNDRLPIEEFVKECLQLANTAASCAQALDDGCTEPFTRDDVFPEEAS